MDNKIATFICLVFSLASYSQMAKLEESSDLIEASENWKNLAFCLCIYEQLPLEDSVRRAEGSVAAYLQTNELYGLEDLETTKLFLEKYLDKIEEVYKSKVGSDLSLMKCIDFYNSKELTIFLKELQAEAVKNE